jgi:hypothetical protein
MKILTATLALALASSLAATAAADCTRIQAGTLVDSNGNPLRLGYDQYGYNYQAHMFNGLYDNFSRPPVPATSGDINLIMKWSDDWLANRDCTGDGRLDRGTSGISMGWLTNHVEGDCVTESGDSIHATYFVKIVWVGPATSPDPWAGRRIWDQYAIIEEVGVDPSNGACLGERGLNRDSLVNPAGFGAY